MGVEGGGGASGTLQARSRLGPPLTTTAPQQAESKTPPEAERAQEPSQHRAGWSVPCLGGPHSVGQRRLPARKWEGKFQSLHRASRVWLPWSQKEKHCDSFKKHSERLGGGIPSPAREGKFPSVTVPAPQAEFLQPAGPLLLHPVGVRDCRSPRCCPAPLQSCPPPRQKGQCCPNKAIGSQKRLPK